jgi:superfamily II DNA/RNA helicase
MSTSDQTIPQAGLDNAALDAFFEGSTDSLTDDDTTEAPELATGPGFDALGLSPVLCKALADGGYTQPTEVQVQAIPAALNGADLRVASSTGSGKTAAFMLPSLELILAARDNTKRREKGKVFGPRVLVLAPTRELAMQVAKAAETYGRNMQGLRVATIVGGVPYGAQLRALKGPLDVLIATPGRLLDHLGTGAAILSSVEVLVLDEADRMLDMGFIEDIEAIAEQTPEDRQTLMFSATFAGHVGQLAQRLTRDAVHIEVASHTDSHDNIEQRLHLADSLSHKNELLDRVLTEKNVDQAVVFTATQRDADILADRLADMGHAVAALHGGMPQGRRNRVLQALRNRQLRVLVATDVAARGIDVPTITHVINYGMPMKPEDYVHRIGRTGRAGRSGLAITLCERRDIGMMKRIERYTTQRVPESVIEGLEPKMRPQGSDSRGPRRDKPMPGQRPYNDRGFGGDRAYAGKRFSPRGEFGGDAAPAPRQDNGFPKRDYQPRDTQGFGDRPQGDRPQRSAKPWDQAPRHEGAAPARNNGYADKRSFGDRPPFADQAGGDSRSFGHKPAGGKPFGSKPFGEKRFGDKPYGGQQTREGSWGQGDRSAKPAPRSDKPFGDKPFGSKPAGGKSFGGSTGYKPAGEKAGFKGKRTGGFGRSSGWRPALKHHVW